jgi:fatty acid desaturase
MKLSFYALGIVLLVVGGGIAISAGPIAWAVLIMVAVPLGLLALFGSAGHEGEHPHFATPPKRDVPKPQV